MIKLTYEETGLFSTSWVWLASAECNGQEDRKGGTGTTPLDALTRLAGGLSKELGESGGVELMADHRATEDFRLKGIHPAWAAVAGDIEVAGEDPEHAMYGLCVELERLVVADPRKHPVQP